MKLVVEDEKDTITVYGYHNIEDVRNEIRNCGMNPEEWVIVIIPIHYLTDTTSHPSFLYNYEIKA